MACSSQGGFKKKYYLAGSLTSVCRDVVEAPNGNLIMVGLSSDTLNGQSFNGLTIVGTDPQGTLLWQEKFGGPKFQYLDNILQIKGAVLKDANCFYHALVAIDSVGQYVSTLLKFNYSGDILWQKRY